MASNGTPRLQRMINASFGKLHSYGPPQLFQDSVVSYIFTVLLVHSAYDFFLAMALTIRLSQRTLSDRYQQILPYVWLSKTLHSVPNQGLLLPSCH